MGKKKKNIGSGDPVRDWVETLRLPDLKRAAIMKGISFRLIGESSVLDLQSWVYRHYHNRDDFSRLEEYDDWLETTLMEEGAIDGPIHLDLKLSFYASDSEGNTKHSRRDPNLLGVTKSKAEQAHYRPRKGAKKTLVFELIDEGYSTSDIIEEMIERFPDVSVGSIKVWCSKARKRKKLREELK